MVWERGRGEYSLSCALFPLNVTECHEQKEMLREERTRVLFSLSLNS